MPVFFSGCMLCFGQSSFFRFNHPEEALRMKSLMPGGSHRLTSAYRNHSGMCAKPKSYSMGYVSF